MSLFALFMLILAFTLPGSDWVKGLIIVIAGAILIVVAVQAINFAASFLEFCRGFCGLILLLKDTYF